MGVNGLWKLIEPAGRPVPLESLENKVLAVDISIWLYQLTKGLQTTGGVVPNAHILGLFNRICKLLYYRIKPIFVFDGTAPSLKKKTIEARKRQKLKAKNSSEQLREKLLDNFLKQKAIIRIIGGGDEPVPSSQSKDLFVLSPLPEEFEEKSSEDEDTDFNTAKVETFCDYQYGKDVHSIDITSEQFKSLPAEIRHEILSELVETRKQNSWAHIHEMPEESGDFSEFQMQRLIKRRNVQKSLDEAVQEVGGRMLTLGELEEMFKQDGIVTDSLAGMRIAKDNVTRFIYISNDKSTKPKPQTKKPKEEKATVTRGSPPKSVALLEEYQIKNNLYEIEQCMFMKDSSSEDEYELMVNDQYAQLLSREEKFSQEEILRVIREQQAKKGSASPQPCSSKSLIEVEKAFSNLSDYEDEPEPLNYFIETEVEPTISSIPNPFKMSCEKPELELESMKACSESMQKDSEPLKSTTENSAPLKRLVEKTEIEHGSPGIFSEQDIVEHEDIEKSGVSKDRSKIYEEEPMSDEMSNFGKSITKLNKMISSVGTNNSSLSSIGTKVADRKFSPIEFSDSDDECFVEVPIEQSCPYFKTVCNKSLEITIDPEKGIEDDLFADVFNKSEEKKEPNVHEEVMQEKCLRVPALQAITNIVPKSRDLSEIFEKVKKPAGMVMANENKEVFSDKSQRPQISEDELLDIQRMLQAEESELLSEKAKHERLGSTITEQMIIEAQELLQLFGVPYVIAPMEAEAQCAFLDQASLTEGTITDDSDIWLFGGQKVYKNFFDSRKFVLQFRNVDIEHFFNLSREQLIQMALLVGSDYTVGIAGIGPVTAIEILAYFSDKTNKPKTEADIAETLRKFKLWIETNRNTESVLSLKVKNVNLSENFPNMHVIEAYLYPTVDESKEGFTWATPDLDRIREYMRSKFGWKSNRIDDILLPIMKRLTDGKKQTTLEAFFKTKPFISVHTGAVSQRVIQAINIMKNKIEVNVSDLPAKSIRKKKLNRTPLKSSKTQSKSSKTQNKLPRVTNQKTPATTACRTLSSMFSPQKVDPEIIPQREKGRLDAAKRKLEAVKIFKASQKTRSVVKKKKTLKPKVDSSYLSESSSEEN